MYYTDSGKGEIYLFDYDRATERSRISACLWVFQRTSGALTA